MRFAVTVQREGVSLAVCGCYDWPTDPTQSAGQLLQSIEARSLTLPPGTDVRFGDAVAYPDGRVWHVTNHPVDWSNPHATHRPGVQATVEMLLVDLCDVERKTGASTTDAAGMVVEQWGKVRTGVPCLVRTNENQPSETVVGEQYVTSLRDAAYLPLSVADVGVDDRIVVTRSRDASLVGVPLFVRGIPRGSVMALRALVVSEVQG